MPDRLDEMMARQCAFAFLVDDNDADIEYITKEYVLSLVAEAIEILRECNWKRHRPIKKEVIQANILEEIIDTLKFAIGLACRWGFTADDIYKEFHRKSDIVEARYATEHEMKQGDGRMKGRRHLNHYDVNDGSVITPTYVEGLLRAYMNDQSTDIAVLVNIFEKRWIDSNYNDLTIYDEPGYLWVMYHTYRRYSYRALQLALPVVTKLISPKTILDHGAGLHATSLFLSRVFPDAIIYSSNIQGPQTEFGHYLLANGQQSNVVIISPDQEQDRCYDLVVAIEVLEHHRMPLLILSNILTESKVLLEQTSYSKMGSGHFLTYRYDGQDIPASKMTRLQKKFLRGLGYSQHSHYWNDRPRIWVRV